MLNPDFLDMLSALNVERAEYMLVGGYALAVHGWPRTTKDIDLWVRPDTANADRVFRALQRFGAPLSDLTRLDLATPGTLFQIGVPPHRIDLITAIDGVEFGAAWERRRVVEINDLSVPVLGRTDLILNKRASGRPQDLIDADHLESTGPEPS